MHLIQSLVGGIVGAEGGTVDIFLRGSSNRAPIYTGFEAQGPQMPSAALTLDAYGGRVVYVDDLVDVIVKDISGTEIRRFVSGDKDAGVEVISNSFTGTNYDSGAVAAGEPNDLQTILNMLITSFGRTNFNVMFGGTPMSLMSALASLGPYYINVKDPAYGATGDGATDDSTAIQAAIDAAHAYEGGLGATVFFPPGTYVCNTHLHVQGNVSLLGCGPMASIIMNNQAAGNLLQYDHDATPQAFQKIQDLALRNSQACTGSLIWIEEITRLFLLNVSVGDANTAGYCVRADDAGAAGWAMVAVGSTFWSGATGCYLVYTTQGPCYFTACGFAPHAGEQTATLVYCAAGCVLLGCWFANAIATSGVYIDVVVNGVYSPNFISGCNFDAPTSADICTAIAVAGTNNVSEVGNSFAISAVLVPYVIVPGTQVTTRAGFGLHSRSHREEQLTVAAADCTPDAASFGVTVIHRTSDAAHNVTPSAPSGPGQFWTLLYCNESGLPIGGAAVTIVGVRDPVATPAIVDGNAFIATFVSADCGGALVWVQTFISGTFVA